MCALCLGGGVDPPAPTAPATRPATGFLCKSLTIGDETYAYAVYVPPEYDGDQAWPVILFLHGSGERGDDGLLQTEVGIGRVLRRNHKLIPAIVVMPQCRATEEAWSGKMGQMALRCLDQTTREYLSDPQRVYLTGLSLGGHGVWYLASESFGRFTALVPICGFADRKESTGLAQRMAPRLAGTPIWCFHGAQDNVVPVEKSREVVEAIRAAGGEVKYTEYPDGNHGVWDRAYDDPELWKWLFAQRRTEKTTEAQRRRAEEK
jgi:predicted peptidase